MTTAIDKKQTEIPGMPQTALGRYAEDFCAQKEKVSDEKEKLDQIGQEIVNVMRKENRRLFAISYEGVKYRFEVVLGSEKLKVAKEKGAV